MSVYDGPRTEVRRILHDGHVQWATVADDHLVLPDGRVVAPDDAVHLPPTEPATIICVHMNFDSRRQEFGLPPIDAPTYFMKPVTSLNAHRGTVTRPEGTTLLNFEGELAVVIGKPTRNIAPAEVADHIAGFTIANDFGLHDFRDTDAGSMLRVKGQDGFSPIGPGLVSGIDPRRSRIRTYRNGTVVQDDRLDALLFPIEYVIADLARHITLRPGDLVLTGTPAGSRPVAVGDVVEVEIDGIGRLTNSIAATPSPVAAVGYQPQVTPMARLVAYAGTEP